jgi:hypothetical protein
LEEWERKQSRHLEGLSAHPKDQHFYTREYYRQMHKFLTLHAALNLLVNICLSSGMIIDF